MRHLWLFGCVEDIVKLGSIRAAAEVRAITSTALNRQILLLEKELGQPIFERLPRGVRLNVAGELFLMHARRQTRDFEHLKVQLADLSGVRRGHVSIASTEAAMPYLLPQQISAYLRQHPNVSFEVKPCDIATSMEQLVKLEADIAIVFEPSVNREFQKIESVDQQITAIFPEGHPLSRETKPLRLSNCLQYPLALPAKVTGVRSILEQAAYAKQLQPWITVESEDAQFLLNTVASCDLVAFDVPVGLSKGSLRRQGLSWRPLHASDVRPGRLHIGQLKNRTLSIAAMKFATQVATAFHDYGDICE
jgi:DNA-binding transcriptional LysR family regulator